MGYKTIEDGQHSIGNKNGWLAHSDFMQSASATPDAPALTVEGRTYSYAELRLAALNVASAISADATDQAQPVAAIYADRGFPTYAGVLGALLSGYAYVPLNPSFPAERNATILERSGASVLVGRPQNAPDIELVLGGNTQTPTTLLFDDSSLFKSIAGTEFNVGKNPYAYILFTSGSTGIPKGVPIRHSNLDAYLNAVFKLVDYGPCDRLSQNFELSFDLSVHDMFVCWRAGAHLVVPDPAEIETPARYVSDKKLTCWFSVPTLGQKMLLQGALQKDAFPKLRVSLFCGEALPLDLAQAWQSATGQRLENWYGPTEATISCIGYRFPLNGNVPGALHNLVPLGQPFPGVKAIVVDAGLEKVPAGTAGELLLQGPQVADGYLEDAAKTASAFVTLAENETPFYRTGDRVLLDGDQQIQFIDRIDNQIKIHGYRVELGEVESVLREASNGHNAIVVPLPLNSPTPTSLAVAIEGWNGEGRDLLEQANKHLPQYMVPSGLVHMEQFPRSGSGKIDRGAVGSMLVSLLEEKQGSAGSTPKKKRKRIQKLVALIQDINPAIAKDELLDAPTLMDAGLDSMGFVKFTLALEDQFGLTLDQQAVTDLSYMTLRQVAREIARRREPVSGVRKRAKRKPVTREKTGFFQKLLDGGKSKLAGLASKEDGKAHPEHAGAKLPKRARRAISFIDCFPALLRKEKRPLALFIGSSGFLRAISTKDIEQRATEMGQSIAAINLGIGALSVEGIAQMSEFVRGCLLRENRRLAYCVFELDPMHLSVFPPPGDLEIVDDYLAGKIKLTAPTDQFSESGWNESVRGTIKCAGRPGELPAEPDWVRRRGLQIRDTFLGRVEMDETAVKTWLRGVEALEQVSERMCATIHPLNYPDLALERAANDSTRFTDLLNRVRKEAGLHIIPDSEYELAPDDFLDKNHMNCWQGRAKFSRQLTEKMLKPLK